MVSTNFDKLVVAAESAHFEGWDFSFLEGRWSEEPPPWDYRRIVMDHAPAAGSLLDMGTGGGEFLSDLPHLPSETWATEAYAPNVPVAKARLEPLGVKVTPFDDDHRLPFPDNGFDLIINRHESYAPREVARLLRPGGHFLTQQVGGRDNWDLNVYLGAPLASEYADWTLSHAAGELQAAGLRINDQREAFTCSVFLDVGAVVYYLRAIPWQIPDFTVERYRDALLGVHEHIQRAGKLVTHSHRFLIECTKPG